MHGADIHPLPKVMENVSNDGVNAPPEPDKTPSDETFVPLPTLTGEPIDEDAIERRGKWSIAVSLTPIGLALIAAALFAAFQSSPPRPFDRAVVQVVFAGLVVAQVIAFFVGLTAYRKLTGWLGMFVSAGFGLGFLYLLSLSSVFKQP